MSTVPSRYVRIGHLTSFCGHVHGWSHQDKEGTSPKRGGRGGGNWADVEVSLR